MSFPFFSTCSIAHQASIKTNTVRIPRIIKNAEPALKYLFLKGLADTDFSVTFQDKGKGHAYPVIRGGFKSKSLVQDLEQLYKEMGFRYCTCYDLIKQDKRFGPTTINYIYLYGKDNFNKWNSLIGFSNEKFQQKVEEWKKEGVCPPTYKRSSATNPSTGAGTLDFSQPI